MRFDETRLAAVNAAGEIVRPTRRPDVAFVWDAEEYLRRLAAQLESLPRGWGRGKMIIASQLTDPLLGAPLKTGLTLQALRMIAAWLRADGTGGQIRVLTKSHLIASPPFLELFAKYRDTFLLGLSIGTLDDDWASRVERFTSPPSARIRAHRALQDAGLRVFMMACPVFPDVLEDGGVERLVDAFRPEQCEHGYAEPVNERNFWQELRDSYPAGSAGYAFFDDVYGRRQTARWSRYATDLYIRLRRLAEAGRWELRYLLYEDLITAEDARFFAGLGGVLLQCGERSDGFSINPHLAAIQRDVRHGRARWWKGKGSRKPGAPERAAAPAGADGTLALPFPSVAAQ